MPRNAITLTVTAGSRKGERFVFEMHDTLLVGCMDDCHVCLPDDRQVSRHHFLLEVNPPQARLGDLGSRNGTYNEWTEVWRPPET